jgi:hypothetical protein
VLGGDRAEGAPHQGRAELRGGHDHGVAQVREEAFAVDERVDLAEFERADAEVELPADGRVDLADAARDGQERAQPPDLQP